MQPRLSDLRRSSKHEQPTFGQYYALKAEEACRQAELNNEPINMSTTTTTTEEAKIAGVQDKNIHTHRTEIPVTEQVAVIWISNDDNARPPDFQGIDLHNTPDGTVNLGTRGSAPLVLPTCFPILDPHGKSSK
ncbi:hypothetical protein QR680_012829 [Steinernema hermaphroditum]|uniref:Uncharacterized protein n=1 Tax=Steinernema hermaphroditum TaxID=289476 RepID=A0AA39M189_9BILA|nr:hypothetical protein QR680_012829 [Steinernema hermaphroditum]